MGYTIVNTIDSVGDNVASSAIDTTGANFLVASISSYTGSTTTPTISDSKSNTWNYLTWRDAYYNAGWVTIAYVENPTVGTGHTFTGHTGQVTIQVIAWSGALTSGVYASQESGVSFGSSPRQPGSLTPSENNCIVIAAASYVDGSFPFSVNTLQIALQQPSIGGVSLGTAIGYEVQTTASANNPTWTVSGSSTVAIDMAVFKAAAGGGGGFQAGWALGSNSIIQRLGR